jgi:hypothetical protein
VGETPDSKPSRQADAKSKDKGKPEASSGEPKTTLTGKPIPSFEERQKRAEAITKKQRGGDDSPAPKAKKTEPSEKPSAKKEPKEPADTSAERKGQSTSSDGESSSTTSKDSKSKTSDSSSKTSEEKPSESSETDADAGKLKSKLDAVTAAFEKGDLKTVAKHLGKGEKIADTEGEKFAVLARQRARITKREAANDQRAVQLDQRESKLREQHGDVGAMKTAYQNKQYHVAAKFWERITGDSFAKTTQLIARATAGLSPEKIAELDEKDRLEREVRQLKAEKEERTKAQQKSATRGQALTKLTEKLSGHQVMALEDGPELVLREIERAWEKDSSSMLTPAAAAKRVLERELDRARRLGLGATPKEPDPVIEDDEPPPAQNRRPRQEAPPAVERRTLAGKPILSFDERMAKAQRLTERRRGA